MTDVELSMAMLTTARTEYLTRPEHFEKILGKVEHAAQVITLLHCRIEDPDKHEEIRSQLKALNVAMAAFSGGTWSVSRSAHH